MAEFKEHVKNIIADKNEKELQKNPIILSSEHIQNEVFNITSEHPYSEDHFERKFQAKIHPSDQSDEKQEEKLIEFKGKNKYKQNMFSSENTKNEVLTFTSEHESSEITLRENPKPRLLHLIKILNNQSKKC